MSCTRSRATVLRQIWLNTMRLVSLACSLVAVVGGAADDLVLDGKEPRSERVIQGGMVLLGGNRAHLVVGPRGVVRKAEYDLVGLFDQHVFGRLAGPNQVFVVDGGETAGNPSAMDRALAVVRRRCDQRIDTFEKVCGLDARQVRTLTMAIESDLKRIKSQIEGERARYTGRTMPANPQGIDRGVLEEVRDNALRCRALLESLPGSGSLFGGVAHGTLSPEQEAVFSHWLDRRRACRWRAMVKTVLVQLDESGLGFVTAQATALEKSLLAEVPPLEVLRDESVGNLDGRMPQFQTILVMSRLGRHKDQWEPLLDSRQRAILTTRIESHGDPDQVEVMLVDQGILERNLAPSRDQETN